MKIAFVYDRINKIGGAERVLESLHEIWPQAPVYTLVYDRNGAPWAKNWQIHPSFVNRFPGSSRHHEWYFWLAGMAFESFNFNDYDVVISITSAEAKGIIVPSRSLHICYLLTPTKYLWSHTKLYTNPFLAPFLTNARQHDYVAAQRADKIIAISQVVAKRCQKYYHRQPDQVIYPPVSEDVFLSKSKIRIKEYYLLVSRLVPSKRIDLAIAAFNQLKRNLIIVGAGVLESKLKYQARENITFVGQISDKKLADLYQKCRALIFPQEEDFGITAVEAQAAGRPVIAYGRGGAREIILPNATGLLYGSQEAEALVKAVQKADTMTFSSAECIKNARRFSKEKFKTQIKLFVEEQWQTHQKQI